MSKVLCENCACRVDLEPELVEWAIQQDVDPRCVEVAGQFIQGHKGKVRLMAVQQLARTVQAAVTGWMKEQER